MNNQDLRNQSSDESLAEDTVTAHLKIKVGKLDPNHEIIKLSGSKVTIGRALDNNVVLSLMEISRNHCIFNYVNSEKKWSIEDISLNGMTVNGIKLTKTKWHELFTGDLICFIPKGNGIRALTYEYREVSSDADVLLDTSLGPRPMPISTSSKSGSEVINAGGSLNSGTSTRSTPLDVAFFFNPSDLKIIQTRQPVLSPSRQGFDSISDDAGSNNRNLEQNGQVAVPPVPNNDASGESDDSVISIPLEDSRETEMAILSAQVEYYKKRSEIAAMMNRRLQLDHNQETANLMKQLDALKANVKQLQSKLCEAEYQVKRLHGNLRLSEAQSGIQSIVDRADYERRVLSIQNQFMIANIKGASGLSQNQRHVERNHNDSDSD